MELQLYIIKEGNKNGSRAKINARKSTAKLMLCSPRNTSDPYYMEIITPILYTFLIVKIQTSYHGLQAKHDLNPTYFSTFISFPSPPLHLLASLWPFMSSNTLSSSLFVDLCMLLHLARLFFHLLFNQLTPS